MKRILTFLFLVLALTLSAAAAEKSGDWLFSATPSPRIGQIGGDWAVLGLARSDMEIEQSWLENYYAAVEQEVKSKGGVLHSRKYTEYSRVVLALTAIGADVRNVGGYDLLMPLGDYEKTVYQGVNGPIWALIALDSGGYVTPKNPAAKTKATRQLYVDELLRRQLTSGGWSLDGAAAEADVTAMALTALAPYRSERTVAAAVERGLEFLAEIKEFDDAEGAAQTLVALCTLGVSDAAEAAHRELLRFRLSDGSFCHCVGGKADAMASEQGFYALVAYERFLSGKNPLFSMLDCTRSVSPSALLPACHADVRKSAVVRERVSFPDTSSEEVAALSERGVLTGYDSGLFGANDTMTRAQFAAVVVRALGLPQTAKSEFADVADGAWYASVVGAAKEYGIVSGKSATRFDPDGTISREEAATMLARAAKLCGMDTARTEGQIRNALAPFSDGASVGAWARESVAFCCDAGILDAAALSLAPKEAVTRLEIAQMLCRVMDAARLL